MESKTLISVEEYLRMSFEGLEPDYVDGELKERHLESTPHSEATERLLDLFRSWKQSHSLFAYPEMTLRISPRGTGLPMWRCFAADRKRSTRANLASS